MQDSKMLRHFDRCLGQVVCGVISGARAVHRKVSQKEEKPIQKILMIELFEMGAAVMLVPSIKFLKKHNPNVEIHCVTTRTCLPVWKAISEIEEKNIHVIESGSAFVFVVSYLKKLWQLRSIYFDLVIDYELFMRISSIFSGLLKSRRQAGFYKYELEGLKRGSFYEARGAFNQNSHIARNYLALTKTACQKTTDLPNYKASIALEELQITPTISRATVNDLLQVVRGDPKGEAVLKSPYFVFCPDVGKTLSVRNYPEPMLAKVIDRVLDEYPSYGVVFIGTQDNAQVTKNVYDRVSKKDRCLDLCGKTNFKQLLSVISGAALLVTNDNGPGHFATLTDTKTVAMFSTDSPFIYGPLGKALLAYSFYQCSPCIMAFNHKTSVCSDNKCLKAIDPEQIFGLIQSVIDGTAKFQTINAKIPYLF